MSRGLEPISELPGDLVFCHSSGWIGRMIRLGQRIRRNPNWELNHVAILDGWNPVAKDWTVIQAEASGVTAGALLADITPGGYHKVVSLPAGVDRPTFLTFIRGQVGSKYSFITDVSIGINILTPRWFHINLRRDGTWICSALAAAGLFYSSWQPLDHVSDIYQVTPAELDDLISTTPIPRKGK